MRNPVAELTEFVNRLTPENDPDEFERLSPLVVELRRIANRVWSRKDLEDFLQEVEKKTSIKLDVYDVCLFRNVIEHSVFH